MQLLCIKISPHYLLFLGGLSYMHLYFNIVIILIIIRRLLYYNLNELEIPIGLIIFNLILIYTCLFIFY